MKLIINTDGGARGNPGPAALGVVIADEAGRIVKQFGRFLGGDVTNNQAEYQAIIAALEAAKQLGASQVELRTDSELAMRQLNHIYKVKNHRIQLLFLQVKNLETQFEKVVYKHVPREQNKLADQMVNKAIDEPK